MIDINNIHEIVPLVRNADLVLIKKTGWRFTVRRIYKSLCVFACVIYLNNSNQEQ